MTEKGYKGGLSTKAVNRYSNKKYFISTAQEIGQDYWSTVILPAVFFNIFPNLFKKIFSFIRNNKEDAHLLHWEIKEMVLNSPENEWFEKMPNPKPSNGWSKDAIKKVGDDNY